MVCFGGHSLIHRHLYFRLQQCFPRSVANEDMLVDQAESLFKIPSYFS